MKTNDSKRHAPALALEHWRSVCLLIGAVLLAQALWNLLTPVLGPQPERVRLSDHAALGSFGTGISLVERGDATRARAVVDLVIGTRTFAGTAPVYVDHDAPQSDYARRYDGRYVFAAPLDEEGTFAIVEIDRERSGAGATVWRTYHVDRHGNVETFNRSAAPVDARQQFAVDLVGAAPRPVAVWPPFAGVLCGGFLFASGLLRRLPDAWPSIGLVCFTASLASLIGWPLMARQGLMRTAPAVTLAICVTLLVAALAGPAVQRRLRDGTGLRSGAVGVSFGVALLAVFVLAQASIAGFIAPVFGAPGGALTPTELLLRDFVRPILGFASVGVLPVALFGAGFAWLNRRLDGGSS